MRNTLPRRRNPAKVALPALFLITLGVLGVFLWNRAQPVSSSAAPPQIALQPVVTGLSYPAHVTHAGDGSGRLFIAELGGTVRVWDGDALLDTPFLDLSEKVATAWEQGLLSLAFHPNYAENGRFFVHYVATEDDSAIISEFRASDDPNRAALEERVLLTIPNERKAHYGGQMQFGPDGYLYIAVGDGLIFGGARRQAQDLGVLPGKVLRLDVDSDPSAPYTVPADNPFVNQAGARPEIWAYGLRNPWRFSFDETTGRLFLGDVGHEHLEEVNLIERGRNYGWPFVEGDRCLVGGFRAEVGCRIAALRGRFAKPIITYEHLGFDEAGGNSVTAGFVYRGEAIPELQGHYLYADYVSGRIWSLAESGRQWHASELAKTYHLISSFGESEAGELFVLDWGAGEMLQIMAQ